LRPKKLSRNRGAKLFNLISVCRGIWEFKEEEDVRCKEQIMRPKTSLNQQVINHVLNRFKSEFGNDEKLSSIYVRSASGDRSHFITIFDLNVIHHQSSRPLLRSS
jgi:hypothetical protein